MTSAGGRGASAINLPGGEDTGTATPLEGAGALGAALGIPQLWLLREDLSRDGSHKGRSADLMVRELTRKGIRQAVVSSSGNAALADADRCRSAGIRLLCLLSPLTPGVKLHRLLEGGAAVILTNRPVELLHHARDAWGMADLRTSTNPLGPPAYRAIGVRLALSGPWAAIFAFSSSGATALGLAEGMRLQPGAEAEIHPVEGWPGGELTRPWYREGEPGEPAGVGELGTRRSRLAPQLRRTVRESGGRGWRISRELLLQTRAAAEQGGLSTSWEGLAALAGASSWAGTGGSGRCAVVLTGAAWQLDLSPDPAASALAPLCDSAAELDQLLEARGFRRAGTP